MDSYTEVTREGCVTRLWSSIKGVLIGLLLFVVAFPLLFWNEGRAVQTAKSLEEGLASVTEIDTSSVDSSHDGDLVYATGMTAADGVLTDPDFTVSTPGLMLRRTVEMYQWKETKKSKSKKKAGGSKETKTTYTYDKVWSNQLIDSSRFKKTAGHQNPASMPISSESWKPLSGVKLGAYEVPHDLVEQIDTLETVTPPPRAGYSQSGDQLYSGNASSPQVGDLRIQWRVTNPARISLVAAQTGATFEPWRAEAGDDVYLFQMGEVSPDRMFQKAQDDNATLTWILRLVGWLLMVFGIGLVFQPFVVLADVIPIIGSFLNAGITIFAALVSLPLALFTIAVAWIFYRPLLAAGLIAGGLVLLGAAFAIGRWRKSAKAT